MASCKSCHAPIVWATMERTGKSSPFEPDPEGEWIINSEGVASHQGKSPEFFEHVVPRYTSHFARCKDAGTWRKK